VNSNLELESWRKSWKSVAAANPIGAFDLRREARRHERRLRARHVLSLGFAVALITFAAYFLQHHFNRETIAWAIVVWGTTLAATAFSVSNWRVLWKAMDRSTAEYLAAYRARCNATLRAVRFGYRFLAVQLAISVPWLTWDLYRGRGSGRFGAPQYGFSMGLLALLTAAFLFAFRRSRRQALRDLSRLEEFERVPFE
jgi:hypothetical protein